MKNPLQNCELDASSGCWNWIGSTHKASGFGNVYHRSEKYYAHQFSYMVFKGDIPKDKVVLHECDNKACVNPVHLYLGSAQERTWKMILSGRHNVKQKLRCIRGHDLQSIDNVYTSPTGRRNCRVCQRIRKQNSRREDESN